MVMVEAPIPIPDARASKTISINILPRGVMVKVPIYDAGRERWSLMFPLESCYWNMMDTRVSGAGGGSGMSAQVVCVSVPNQWYGTILPRSHCENRVS